MEGQAHPLFRPMGDVIHSTPEFLSVTRFDLLRLLPDRRSAGLAGAGAALVTA